MVPFVKIINLDKLNEDRRHNGTVRENHVKWGEKLRAYFPELGETTMTVDKFTSLDQSDDKAGNAISSESTDQEHLEIDPSKLGLVLSQMHRAKRASPDKEIIFIFFDDKNTEFYGYYIDEAMRYISNDSRLIPEGARLVQINLTLMRILTLDIRAVHYLPQLLTRDRCVSVDFLILL